MKNKQNRNYSIVVSIFLILVLASLGAISYYFPKDGFRIWSQTFRFPKIEEYLEREKALLDTTTTNRDSLIAAATRPSPEALLEQRMAEMRLEEEAEYISYFTQNPARIYFPYLVEYDTLDMPIPVDTLHAHGDTLRRNYAYLDDFYCALDEAREERVHIAHYGDSQIEEDRITKNLRLRLQTDFSGGGVGLVPFIHTYYNLTITEILKGQYTRYSLIPYYRDAVRETSAYGPLMQFSEVQGTETMDIFPRKNTKRNASHYFNQLLMLTSPSRLMIETNGEKVVVQDTNSLAITPFELPDSTEMIKLTVSGHGDVMGLSLCCDTGVVVDNIALRGSSGTFFRQIDSVQMQRYFEYMNTRLIILEFGGNTMPGITSDKAIHNYVRNLIRQMQALQRMAPQAKIIFVGPSDMVSLEGGTPHTMPMLPKFDDYAAEQMNRAGFAYWSMFRAMGGENAMLDWVRARPQLAASDYVHFTRSGADRIGTLLTDAIMTGYEYYKIREKYLEH